MFCTGLRILVILLATVVLLWPAVPGMVAPPFWQHPEAHAFQPLESDEASTFAPGEVLLKLRSTSFASKFELESSLLPRCSAIIKETMPGLEVYRLGVPVGQEIATIQCLKESPLVDWAEPNYLRSLLRVPNDALYHQFQWNFKVIQAEDAWEITTGSDKVTVAVLDTGIDATHPDLAGKLEAGYDFLNDDSDPTDDSGHGTHNAGIIGAASNNGMGVAGLSWGARIMPLKVLDNSGVGPDSVIARGIVHATDHGARIINMSFGSSMASQVLARAVRYAYDKGVLLVAAAGNTAHRDNAPIYPASFEQVLAVGAVDETGELGDFSQHHPYVGVSAPGVKITSTFWREAGFGSYASASGTSSAAPHVSGLAALIWSVNPSLTNDQVKQIIERNVDDLGVPGRDEYYGTGRINAYKAVHAVASPTEEPSPSPVPASPTPSTAPGPTPGAPSTPAQTSRSVWYFPEGSTVSPFDMWLLLQNPNNEAVTAKVTFMKRDGSQVIREEGLPPNSRKTLFVNQLIPNEEISMKVESDFPLLAERSMYVGSDGHGTGGVSAPSKEWYMAEGSTHDNFDTWILLQNPQGVHANVTLTFLTSEGKKGEMALGLPPTSRRSIYVNQIVPDAEVSTIVLSDQPIIAERSMYFRQSGGHGGVVASQLARNWYLAEGQTGQGLQSWILVLNPNEQVANLKVTFFREDGTTSAGDFTAPPNSRLSLYLNNLVDSGKFGVQVDSDQPIAVERSVYFAGGRGGHNVVATPQLSQEWYLPEGSTKHPFTETVAIVNPGQSIANLTVIFVKNDGGTESRNYMLQPTSRFTLNVNELLPDAEVSTRVVSDTPIAVERSMYFANGLGGTCTFGIPR
ncbi:MAG: S8 family peptidase [Chloroflexota bacterium]|jgi:type VII secretion-associated serine protease mycosin